MGPSPFTNCSIRAQAHGAAGHPYPAPSRHPQAGRHPPIPPPRQPPDTVARPNPPFIIRIIINNIHTYYTKKKKNWNTRGSCPESQRPESSAPPSSTGPPIPYAPPPLTLFSFSFQFVLLLPLCLFYYLVMVNILPV